MIFTYKYLPNHKIEGFQKNIDYFFEQLFLLSPERFDEKLQLQKDFIAIANESKIRLINYFEELTILYFKLTEEEKSRVKEAYIINARIEELCNDETLIPITYIELEENFAKVLKEFCVQLWEKYPFNVLLKNNFGTVQEHFNDFMHPNHQSVLICPFCGTDTMLPSGGLKRNDYDHYLAKTIYPFTSINFHNLFPMCDSCNSREKGTDDPLHDEFENRRQALYPFDSTYKTDKINIVIEPKEDYNRFNLGTILKKINWEYSLLLNGEKCTKLETWDSVYKIKRRYKEYILGGLENIWFDALKMKYKQELNKGINFTDFKNEYLANAKYMVNISALGVVAYSYYCFVFSIEDIEVLLNGLVYS